MVRGQLEIILLGAKGLDNNDLLTNIDPYVILTYQSHERRSTVKKGGGSNPYWEESFVYSVNSDDVCELELKLMDADSLTQDEFLGKAIIPFHSVFGGSGIISAAAYNLINNNQEHCGEIQVAFLFIREVRGEAGA